MAKIRPGGWCWIGLAASVTVADVVLIRTKNRTMSSVFGDSLNHPLKRWPVFTAWTVLTLHLFGNFLPDRVKRLDPIRFVANLVDSSLP